MPAGRLVEVPCARWDDLLAGLGMPDVYLARGFVAASAALAAAEPVLLHLAGDRGDVVFPALVRADPVDIVTPYGYGGPAGAGDEPPFAAFAEAYAGWCAARGAVSTFVAFHPLARTGREGFHVSELAGTVAWALDGDLRGGMHAHHRRLVRRALGAGAGVEVIPRPEDLAEFAAAYEATMRRAGAAPFYFFPPGYWEALRRDVPLVLVEVRRDGELLAAVLGMGAPPWLHYHLGASTDAGRGSGAPHLALLGLAEWGREHEYAVLHLGGGVGGRADSLLEYKRRFAPDGLVPARVGKAVHDLPRYLELAGTAEVDWDGFFPAYRAAR